MSEWSCTNPNTALSAIIKNAKKAALRDNYNQVILSSNDGYSFSREGYGQPVTPVFPDEKIIGRVKTSYRYGCLAADYVEAM